MDGRPRSERGGGGTPAGARGTGTPLSGAGTAPCTVLHVARGCGAAGSALDWQSRGQGFESPQLHPSSSARTSVLAFFLPGWTAIADGNVLGGPARHRAVRVRRVGSLESRGRGRSWSSRLRRDVLESAAPERGLIAGRNQFDGSGLLRFRPVPARGSGRCARRRRVSAGPATRRDFTAEPPGFRRAVGRRPQATDRGRSVPPTRCSCGTHHPPGPAELDDARRTSRPGDTPVALLDRLV